MNFLDKIRKRLQPNQKPLPMIGTVAVANQWDKYSTHPSQNLSPQKLGEIFREAEEGNLARQMELFEEMEEKDTHLFSQLQTRKYGVAGLDWNILPASDSEEDKKAADFIGEILYGLENLDELILDLLDAIGKGFSAAEIMWGYERGKVIPEDIKWRHPKKFCFDEFDTMRILTESNRSEGIAIPENKFIVHKYKARSGSPTRAGVLRVVSWMYLFKNYAVKDWLAFSEVYGMPIRIGKYEPGTSQADKEALMQALRSIGADGAGIVSNQTSIEFIESGRTEGLLYDRLAKFCNGEISKAILGQTLTTEVGDSGSRALGDTHNLVRHDLLEADSKALEKTLRRDLIRPLVEFNLGADVAIPYFKLAYESPEDLVQEATKYQTLIGLGLPVSEEHLYEKFGIPTPEENQKILVPPAAAPANMGGFPFKQIIAKEKAPLVNGQTAADALADQGVQESLKLIEESLNPLLTIVQSSTSLVGLREKLIAAYQDLPAGQLDELMAKALYVADLQGRAEVMDDGD